MIYNRKILAAMYGVSLNTFKSWLMKISNLEIHRGQRLFTPKQVEIIFEALGTPVNVNKRQ